MSRLLGAVLAGGRSRRFGSDKAVALLGGRRLIDHVVAALEPRVERVVVCGREGGLPDRPGPGLGPLGGLGAALRHGAALGFEAVLAVPCDTPALPVTLLARLADMEGAAFVADCPVVGLWPCDLADALDEHLRGGDRSMRGWARRIGAVAIEATIGNVNTQDDLARLAAGR